VTAADFMASSVAANERLHAPLFPGVVDFLVADVCLMTVPPGSYDVVFSNWLLMYLSDGEVAAFARKALTWLAPGGTLFFRESCFRQSGDRARGGFNPTHYRNPRDYFAAFDGAAAYVDGEGGEERRRQQQPGGGENGGGENGAAAANGNGNGNGASNGNGSGSEKKKRRTRRVAYFELDVAKCVDTYVAVKGNQNQICWRYVRREADVEEAEAGAAVPAAAAAGPPAPPPPPPRPPAAASSSLRAFLDGSAYTPAALARYEWTFGGAGFVSPGGPAEARELLLHPRLALAEAVAAAAARGGGGGGNGGGGWQNGAAAAAAPSASASPARLLDVGCGPGGGAFLASELFPRGALHVHAVDLSVNMVLLALERAAARATGAAAQEAEARAAAAEKAAAGAQGAPGAAAAAAGGAGAAPRADDEGAAGDAPVAFGASVTLEVSDVTLRRLVGPARRQQQQTQQQQPTAARTDGGAAASAAAAAFAAAAAESEAAEADEPAAPAAGPFDAAVSRDALLHVRDKAAALARLRAWLRPGTGSLLITDYARPEEEGEGAEGEKEARETGGGENGAAAAGGGENGHAGRSGDGGLSAYASERRYHLETASGYARLVREAGFADVRVEDRTARLAEHLRAELGRLEGGGGGRAAAGGGGGAPGAAAAETAETAAETAAAAAEQGGGGAFPGTEAERRAMADRWRAKLARAEAGQQRWLLITARAP